MKKKINYTFHYLNECNMCNSKNYTILGKRLNLSQGRNPRKKIGITTTIVKCTNCNLIFSNPQPIPNSIQDHYGIDPENYWQESYFKIDDNYFRTEINKLKTLTTISKGMKSLDIGAGLGKGMKALEKEGFEAYGIEASEQFHTKAVQEMGISPEKLTLGMIENVNFPDNFFDFISFGAVLEHLYDPSFCINKAMKWLKPNGIMHIEVPSSEWFVSKLFNFYFKIIGTDYVTHLSPMHEPFHLHEFSSKTFKEHALKNNYRILSYQNFVCETYLPRLFNFIIVPYMRITKTGMISTFWLQK